MTVSEFQHHIEAIYLTRDAARGLAGTFQWFIEEVGELARALRGGNAHAQREEFADVFAWLSTLASLAGVQLEDAACARYGAGCPKCRQAPCACLGADTG